MEQQAILFDLDGTLVETLPDIAAAINKALRLNGFPEHPTEAYRTMVGWGLRESVRRAVAAGGNGSEPDDSTLDRLVAAAHDAYAACPVDKSKPYAGIEAMIDDLAARSLPLAVLSNKPDDLVVAIVDALFPRDGFAIVRGRRPDVPAKPDPTSTISVLAELGVTPSDALFVGDSEVDMATALHAGCVPVGISWGYQDPKTVQRAGAAYMIDSVKQLHEFLKEIDQ